MDHNIIFENNSVYRNILNSIGVEPVETNITLKNNFNGRMKGIKENIEYYKEIKNNQNEVFKNINNKNYIFDLFVIVNYEVFKKPYFDSTFSSFLKNNVALIKQYFGENLTYNDILLRKKEKLIKQFFFF